MTHHRISIPFIPLATDCTFDNMRGEIYTFYTGNSSLVLKSVVLSNTLQRDSKIWYHEDDETYKLTGVSVSAGPWPLLKLRCSTRYYNGVRLSNLQ